MSMNVVEFLASVSPPVDCPRCGQATTVIKTGRPCNGELLGRAAALAATALARKISRIPSLQSFEPVHHGAFKVVCPSCALVACEACRRRAERVPAAA